MMEILGGERKRMEEFVLELDGIGKSIGKQRIIGGVSLRVRRGEFVTLLGPSGCGKTTTLRVIAGLETADEGRVLLNGADVTTFPPDKRNVNTVFQNYALFPHMNVYDNIAYGPRIRRVPKGEIPALVAEMLSLVQMDGYGKRMPNQLSGGQRQRIAIARALINRPDVVLLDEPLGALDLQLRRHMQMELKRIQKKAGVTFIYVTHDQEEALNMSDRLAIMNGGAFEQVGSPEEIYDRPATRFVAEFVGTRNLLDVTITTASSADFGGRAVPVAAHTCAVGEKAFIAIHADKLRLAKEAAECSLPGTVTDVVYSGAQVKTWVAVNDTVFTMVEYNVPKRFAPGDAAFVSWDAGEAVVIRG